MTHRMFAASCAAMLVTGLMLWPVATAARSGGFAGARSFHGGLRPALARPAVPAPIVHNAGGLHTGSRAFPRFVSPALRLNRFRTTLFHHRRRLAFGFPLTAWSGYAPYYDPGFYPAQYDQPPYDPVPYPYPGADYSGGPHPTTRFVPVIVRPTGCSSTTQRVPSEHGGERTITVVRC